MKVRLLRPARARLSTLTLVGSKRLINGSPQPRPPLALLLAVESPTTNIVVRLGLIHRLFVDFCFNNADFAGHRFFISRIFLPGHFDDLTKRVDVFGATRELESSDCGP